MNTRWRRKQSQQVALRVTEIQYRELVDDTARRADRIQLQGFWNALRETVGMGKVAQ